ncbi:MAG: hydroxyisourate hydrolase, partial [Loktanella sp.]|nr:hydroxyisourate hydrolase [Loktanella sp.]
MSGFLTTHVLDTARGCPAAGMRIDLFKIDGETRVLVRSLTTNADGRTDSQILPAAEFTTGTFELVFFAGDY